jgi:hypothetical protein
MRLPKPTTMILVLSAVSAAIEAAKVVLESRRWKS